MMDVLVALVPVVAASLWVFRQYAAFQIGLCVIGCLAAEALFTKMRKKPLSLSDGSAAVTGVILGLSLPSLAPWYVGVIGSFAAIGLGKTIFGGLGYNIFNPAMVGRAFVMIAFPAKLGASAYVDIESGINAITMATPLTVMKQLGEITPISDLLMGTTNGSLGETSAIACLVGGIYLCKRRSASWEIPLGVITSSGLVMLLVNIVNMNFSWSFLHEIFAGSLLFGAFFIATDPVSSPLTPKGKWIYGAGIGLFIILIRKLSGYPEGVMFSVLLMNALAPLINRWTIPTPMGGAVPERKV